MYSNEAHLALPFLSDTAPKGPYGHPSTVPTAPLRAKGPIASLSVPELRSKLQDPEELQRLEFTDALLARRAVWEYETFIPRVDRRLGVNNNFFTGPGKNL